MRIVVKVGTAVVSRTDGKLALGRLGGLVEQLCELADEGNQVILVSSGAVGLGAARLGLSRPTELADRQAAAATGQGSLIALYDGLFRRQGRYCAQVLLTESDFHHRAHYLNLASALERLLQLGVVPVINENDVVSTVELALTGKVFGDNDRLGALVAASVGADMLVLLSDVDAVYTAPPGTPGAQRIAIWQEDTSYQAGEPSRTGTGGIASKVAAARVAARAGVDVVIASGLVDRCVQRVVRNQDTGTHFPAEPGMNRRRQWIAFATAPAGEIEVNDGARRALVERGASLLWPGVVEVRGEFLLGDVVEVVCNGVTLARGVVGASSTAIRAGLGRERGTLLHRNDLAILVGI